MNFKLINCSEKSSRNSKSFLTMITCTAFYKYYLGKTDMSKQGHLKYPIFASKVKNARNHRYMRGRGEAEGSKPVISGILYLLLSGVYNFSLLPGAKVAFYTRIVKENFFCDLITCINMCLARNPLGRKVKPFHT